MTARPLRPVRTVLPLLALAVASCGPKSAGAAVPPPVPPGVRASQVERAYAVHGTTREEIGRSLRENSLTIGGGRFQGVHAWSLTWSFRYQEAGGACRMRSVQVRIASETRVPRWEDRAQADRVLVGEWDRYIGRLRAHENSHRGLAYRAAREVQRELKRLTSPTCGTMVGRANSVAREIVERYQRRNRQYDEETRHGQTEGVGWPVPPTPEG